MHDLNPPKQVMDLKCWTPTSMIFAFLLILPMTCAVHIKVKECPVTETAWKTKSQIFTCESTQVYHCIQDNEGRLMETCMVAYIVQPHEEGGCPWASYSSERGSILGAVFHRCEGNGCPQKNDSEYRSNELYKYPVCLHQYNEMAEVMKSTLSPSLSTEITKASNDINGIVGVIIAILTTAVIMIIIFMGAVLIRRYRRSNGNKNFFNCKDTTAEENKVFLEGSSKLTEMEEVHKDKIHKCKLSSKDRNTSKGIKWNAKKKSELSKAVDKEGQTVLHHACLAGNTSLVKSSLDIFIDLLYIKDNDGCTPFHLAGFSGSVEIVQVLIGCIIRSKDNTGQTIVHHACQAGHISLVKYLIDLYEDILDIEDNNQRKPLHCTDKAGQTIVHHACLSGHLSLVKLFIGIEKGVLDVQNVHGLTPFHCAGFSGSVELVQYLIKNGCDVYSKDKDGRTIVHIACEKGHTQLVEYLIGIDEDMLHMKDINGMTPYQCKDKRGWTILHTACSAGHIGLVKLVIKIHKGMLNERDKFGMTPFHQAGCSGSVELVHHLLDNGCDVYSKNNYGQTIVHMAFEMGHISLAKFLISRGKTILETEDHKRSTPFHSAGFSGSVELVQYLIENGCDMSSKDNDGRTIVHYACQEGHVSLVKYLIDIDKSLLHIKDNNGLTPFHCAGFSGSVELVQYLIDNGCDVYSKDNDGQTIVHKACDKGHDTLVKYLKDMIKMY